jgi:lysophospholipase L1-like esterase
MKGQNIRQMLSKAHVGCVALSATLTVLTALETLLLGHNDIREEGAVALAAALHHLPELIVLSLGRNDIGSAGAAALVPYFRGKRLSQLLQSTPSNPQQCTCLYSRRLTVYQRKGGI